MKNYNVKTITTAVSSAPTRTIPSLEPLIAGSAPQWVDPLRDPSTRMGLYLVAAMTALLGGYDYWHSRTGQEAHFAVFFVHYGVAIFYFCYLLAKEWLRVFRRQPVAGLPQRLLSLVLWLLSCFALNRSIPVFQSSTAWLCYVLVLSGSLMVAMIWFNQLPVRGQQVLALGLSAVWWLFVYQAIYIAPIYHIGILGLVLLGISIHAYIPLIIAFTLGKWLVRSWAQEHLRPAIRAGLALPLVIVAIFVWQWSQLDNRARYSLNEAQTRQDDDLPNWTRLAQQLSPGWLTDKWLYSSVVYDQEAWWGNQSFGGHFTEATLLHDPLVLIASKLSPPLALNTDDRARVIAVLNDAHHQTEEHLWNGRDLRIANVTSQARIYPAYRLAYTEKTLTIQNIKAHTGPQEAVFTVQLPAGSVVSSLSLWVNGVEEKGVLTTQAKADTAYRTVVGVDSRQFARDPSVVRWLEGNRVSVRVFPCSPGEMRQVKLGITSPLRLEKDELVYENPYFDGPDTRQATETIKLDFDQKPADLTLPDFLQPSIFRPSPYVGQGIRHEGTYQSNWSVRMKAPALATAGFSLDGQTYTVTPAQFQGGRFDPATVYLDLNQSWTRSEFDAVLKAADSRPVWVYDESLVLLTPDNRDAYFDQLTRQRFSLFPIYRIPTPATALLVTKSDARGPQLDNLVGSPFARRLGRDAAKRAPLHLFSLSAPAPLFQTLSELRAVQPLVGSTTELASVLRGKQFMATTATDNAITIPQAGIVIKREIANLPAETAAPDHLARLFAYNHLMGRIGQQYFTRNFLTDSLLTEAQQANIVSPVSGLIVLETQADYDRFGIKRDLKGLANATLKNHGAVPEPHEWAMLLLLTGIAGWVWWRKGEV